MSSRSLELSLSIMIPCPEIKQQNVRRCLFGKPDPEKQSEDLKRQDKAFSEADVKRFIEKWAFDPATGPLKTGPYEFIPVDPLCEIPSYYTKGYPSVKSKPARLTPDCVCYVGVRNRPSSAKRKLELEDKDENSHTDSENLQSFPKCLLRGIDSQFQSFSSVSNVFKLGDSVCNRLCGSSVGLTRSSSAPTLPELSPMSRNREIMTPPSKPKAQVQSSIKDHMPNKKQRLITKALPRT